MLNDDLQRWHAEIERSRGQPGSPFAEDAEIHVINVSLHDVPDDKVRHSLLRVPTAFTIEAQDVIELQRAGATAIRQTQAFEQLRESLSRLSRAP